MLVDKDRQLERQIVELQAAEPAAARLKTFAGDRLKTFAGDRPDDTRTFVIFIYKKSAQSTGLSYLPRGDSDYSSRSGHRRCRPNAPATKSSDSASSAFPRPAQQKHRARAIADAQASLEQAGI